MFLETAQEGSGDTPSDGWFCPPALALDPPPAAHVVRDEIFGPLATLERVRSVDAACDAVEASPWRR